MYAITFSCGIPGQVKIPIIQVTKKIITFGPCSLLISQNGCIAQGCSWVRIRPVFSSACLDRYRPPQRVVSSVLLVGAYLLELCFWHSFQEGCSFTRDSISDPQQAHSPLCLTSSLSSHRMCCAPEARIWPIAPRLLTTSWVSLVTSDPTNDPYQWLPRIPVAPTANCPPKHILEVSSHDLNFYLHSI